jgi:tripartite-type tricarboxylate transporter receptor subunit TctC
MQPVGALASYAMFLLVNPALPVTSVSELIALAKEKPGTLSFASGGNGATGHLAGERLRSMANIDVTHIPYKGNVLGQQDVMAGRVSFMFDFHPTSIAAVQAGRLRMLASTGKERSMLTPDIPTLDESGLPGFNIVSWYAVFAPPGTPRPIVDSLNRTLIAMTRTPDMQAKLRAQAFEAMELTPEEITARIQAETAVLAPIVRQAGITAN